MNANNDEVSLVLHIGVFARQETLPAIHQQRLKKPLSTLFLDAHEESERVIDGA